ncbi:G-type lectin S-receptor-like serine/threonine-protein kinase SD2-5 [Magnolia sinica]|uniref:G-type lectin S-receptor-like serine/threonine-protein kinase SD2-5 n=1 Tax=Magnolia sinica TaxID=86752 RepID=UPI00265B6519|nr:G-type lectin S-receptor-like serine/threonine-protein kinase SD2-5 [Magnolia sinica]
MGFVAAMNIWCLVHRARTICLFIVLLFDTCIASTQSIGRIAPVYEGSQMNWIDNQGLFLLSEDKNFAFGFNPLSDITSFLLVVMHVGSSTVVWSANRGSPVSNSDKFVFGNDGNARLELGNTVIWSTNTTGKGAAMELQNSGNLVLLSNDSMPLWQSFDNPTDTLLSGQNFTVGMKLISNPNSYNLSFHLEINSGDLMFYADFQAPQPYWSMQKESRKTINNVGGDIYLAALDSNSWKAYDRNQTLLWQFIFSPSSTSNITWAAILGSDGLFSFYNLQNGISGDAEQMKIPQDSCQTPESCGPYSICYSNNRCRCPSALNSGPNCNPGIISPCSTVDLVNIEDGLSYFALNFISPVAKADLTGCKDSCRGNCSCIALFFDEKAGKCFLFDHIGSLQQSGNNSPSYISYIKVPRNSDSGSNPSDQGSSGKKRFPFVVIIALATVLVIVTLIYLAFRCLRKKKVPEPPQGSSEEDNFLENLSGMPIRFSYKDLETATNNFSVKLGQGGFGSVYQGMLPDGSQVAVKQLEGIGQGKKEFRAEVSIIGSIHHIHLVRLRGFCAEGSHRLLAYEYMANGSLDRWIFQNNRGGSLLDWDKRFNIALATAKGLAYLHEDCSVKIVHCDIKPENVLLDDNYLAKVSDFGLAKLMTREQSHVFTTLRGTRGYLAPEWITNYAISEKSDVYSFGMVLLEIIGGRKNFDPAESSEKAHFPSYVFKKMEEGKLKEILDARLRFDELDERVSIAIKVALWCIQEDMHLRPSMTRVVQMLEGLSDVPQPPTSSQLGFRLYSNFLKSVSEEGTSSGPSDCNSDLSAVRLSGPR